MALAEHENVVKCLGLEHVENMYKEVLVMEYCNKGNLFDLIESNVNGMITSEYIRFARNLFDALQHLWQKNIIHRDIKPSNILISETDNGETLFKLADFGAARILKPNEKFGSLYGTYEYIHPDIFAKFYYKALDIIPPTQTFTHDHELWSLGVTLYEAATGRLPFSPEKERQDKQTMFKMTTEKEVGCISAIELENGQIQWSKELPKDCELDENTKQALTSFLAGLLEVSIHYKSMNMNI